MTVTLSLSWAQVTQLLFLALYIASEWIQATLNGYSVTSNWFRVIWILFHVWVVFSISDENQHSRKHCCWVFCLFFCTYAFFRPLNMQIDIKTPAGKMDGQGWVQHSKNRVGPYPSLTLKFRGTSRQCTERTAEWQTSCQEVSFLYTAVHNRYLFRTKTGWKTTTLKLSLLSSDSMRLSERKKISLLWLGRQVEKDGCFCTYWRQAFSPSSVF